MPLVFQLILRIHASNPGNAFLGFILSRVSFGRSLRPPPALFQKNHHESNIFPHIFLFTVRFSLPKPPMARTLS